MITLPSIFTSDASKLNALYAELKKLAIKANAKNFPIGSRLIVLEGYHDTNANHAYPGTDEYIAATVENISGTRIQVMYDSMSSKKRGVHAIDHWWLSQTGVAVRLTDFEKAIAKHNVPLELNTSHLDKLVLDQETKGQILNVLKQHKYMVKIFEEWGLGEIIEYGKAMSLLFYGPPGTGKTWAATCIAKALGKEIMVISAAEIQTSEPGGANRNIEAAFKQAKTKGDVLFLDECDGLITDRAHVGMILASEINTLLTCLEKFEGVVIFATNRADTLDPAMARRISLMVEFHNPDEKSRLGIWEVLLPKKMPLAKDVNLKKLAKFELTGGFIKNVILNAARAAAAEGAEEVNMKHFAAAIKKAKESKDVLGTHTSRKEDFVKARG